MADLPTSLSAPVPTASVVICCYTDARFEVLCAAIRSARALQPPAHEILVVVDHNPTLRERLGITFDALATIDNMNERGLSGARNAGVANTTGDVILFLDDDAEAAPDLLARLMRHMAEPVVLGAGAAVLPGWPARRPRWFPDEFLWVVGCTYEGLRPGQVRNPIGAAMCLRRSVFEAVGGFDGSLGRLHDGPPVGGEETELCIRARLAHPEGRFVFEPGAVCRHNVTAGRTTWRYFAQRCYAEGITKARLAEVTSEPANLSSERTYVARTLPLGVLRGIRDGVVGFDSTGFARAGAIMFGLAATVAGFLTSKVRARHRGADLRTATSGSAR